MAKRPGDVHVSKNESGGWKVTQGGEKLSRHKSQGNASDRGKSEAKADGVDLVVHGRDGRIRSKDSYGKDASSVRDTEH